MKMEITPELIGAIATLIATLGAVLGGRHVVKRRKKKKVVAHENCSQEKSAP